MRINVGSFLFLILTLFVWSSCSPQKERNSFQQAYSLLNTAPDSAIHILKEIDKLSLSEKDQAVYSLLYTMAQDKSGIDVDSDSLMGIAYNYFKEREQDTLYAKCQYYMGKYYLLNDSNRLAEDCFTRAIRVSREKKDYYTTYLALDRLGNMLRGNNPEIAVEYAKQAYQLYEERLNNNNYNKVYLLIGIGDSYSLSSEIDSARIYLNKALAYAQESKVEELQSSVFQSLSVLMRKQEKNDSVLYFSKKAWDVAPKRNSSLASNLAYAYLMADSVSQSTEILMQLCKSKSEVTRRAAYKLLTECAYRTGNLQKAKEYSDSTLAIYRRTHESTLKDRAAYYQSSSKRLLALETMKREKERQWFALVAAGMVLLFILLFLFFYYRNRVLLYRNETLRIEKEKEIESLLYRSDKEKQEIRLKQKETQIRLLRDYVCSKVDLQSMINESMTKKNTLIDEKLWVEVEELLNALEGCFVIRLKEKYPDLTQGDLRFCMLLRLDLSIKKLSEIYDISKDSIKQKQSKFKHKIGIANSSISLRRYLQSY